MSENPGLVIVVDDDTGYREALDGLLRSVGLEVMLFGSVAEFLRAGVPDGPCCLVLDVRMPGQSGLELQDELNRMGASPPIIFISGHGDVPMTVRAMKAGAVEFLEKPLRDQDLLDAIHVAMARDKTRRAGEAVLADLRRRFDSLTARERQVMAQVVVGRLNKQIAGDLGVSEITVKVHRGQMMKKMGVRTVADLVRMSDSLSASVS
jgi:FixJ family two-component response regulator